jgi:hypothetical protein
MIRQMFLLSAALAAVLSLASTTQAGSVVETGYDVAHPGNFAITGGGTATDISISYYLGAGATITSTPVITTSIAGVMSTITPVTAAGLYSIELYNFNSASMSFTIKFDESNAPSAYQGVLSSLSGVSGTVDTSSTNVGALVSTSAVPEPSSIALLGIGISGFIAFRRRFSRKPTVA